METLSCGVDLVEIERITSLDPAIRTRFIQRVFTPAEQALCSGRNNRLAGRFAAKEAVAKALGTGIGEIHWRDIEVLASEKDQPELFLHGQAKILAGQKKIAFWSVSITHTSDLAMAFVVATSST